MDNLLLVDIGGTNMRHAVANASNDNISEIEKSSFDPENFDSFLEKLINKHFFHEVYYFLTKFLW